MKAMTREKYFEVDEYVPRQIAALREQSGLSQDELAERLGVATQDLNWIESYMMDPRPSDLAHIAAALNVPIAALFPATTPLAANADTLANRLCRLPQPALNSLLAVVSALENIHAEA